MKKIEPGIYKHFKGNLYEVIGTAHHTETLEEVVVYRALYDSAEFGKNALWIRPVKMFLETVQKNGKTIPRFKFISETKSNKTILSTLCYIRKDNQTLMLHRVKKENDIHENKWTGVGGKFEQGETPEECATREVKEETGLTVKKLTLKGILTEPKFGKDGSDWLAFVFVINKFTGKLSTTTEGNLEWVNNDKILDLNLWSGDKLFIPLTFKDKFFSIKFVYGNKELKDYSVKLY